MSQDNSSYTIGCQTCQDNICMSHDNRSYAIGCRTTNIRYMCMNSYMTIALPQDIYVSNNFIPLYNIYSTYIEIWLVETIPRVIYQNIVFPSQQHRISFSAISYFPYSKFSTFNALVIILFDRNNNNTFVNKDGQKISFGRIHQNVGLVE